MTNKSQVIMKMALAILMKKGELSISDIHALPLVDSEELATAIAFSLFNRFNVEFENNIIRLKDEALRPKLSLKNKVKERTI